MWSAPAEFPAPDVTRRVIEAIGRGDMTHANIAAEAGSRARVRPEIDLVGVDTAPVAGTIGAVKWLDRNDLSALRYGGAAVPGFEPGGSALAVVSRAGVAAGISGQLALCWGPESANPGTFAASRHDPRAECGTI